MLVNGDVEARHAEILAELMAVRKTSERSGFQPYRDPVHAGSEPRLAKDGLGVEGRAAMRLGKRLDMSPKSWVSDAFELEKKGESQRRWDLRS